MESFIPNAPVPPIPIPFGQLTITVAKSLKPSHPITITNPILLSDFPDTPQGAITYTALQRVSEILSHGFLTPTNTPLDESAPNHELWLSTVSQILVHIHNSIHCTHNADPLPNAFGALSPDELDSYTLLSKTISALSLITVLRTSLLTQRTRIPSPGRFAFIVLKNVNIPSPKLTLNPSSCPVCRTYMQPTAPSSITNSTC